MVNKKQVGIGAGVLAAATAAAAAGYYFYGSKDAPRHRKIAARWATDLKRDAVREVKKIKRVDRVQVMRAIDTAAKAYRSARAIDAREFVRAARELKDNWQEVAHEAVGKKKIATRTRAAMRAKKTAKKRVARG